MTRPRLALALAATLLLAALPADAAGKPRRGDFALNDGPVRAARPIGHLAAGALWVVVSRQLAGRATPDPRGRVVRSFCQGMLLQADIGRGGSDEVLSNVVASDGTCWMRVRTALGTDLACYVRANPAFIVPVREAVNAPLTE